ncbi:D-hexose-6-phosphate mutarotase [Kitasatospora sp. NPDC051853]|uniref:D-hexose-6-phosphate mutarotase n=1 Tax=Kitasatospora sp. NPDC051853 TaxID=3364058 RepID=UPI00379D7A00
MPESFLDLPVRQDLSPSVTLRRKGDIPVVVVDHPTGRAVVSLQGAQLVTWQPSGEQPVVWVSDASSWTEGVAIRGGVPVCWPWFGPAGSPSHGFARVVEWELAGTEETEEGVELVLTLGEGERTLALWPHAFTATVRIRLGRECTVELEVAGEHESTAALHTYLHVGAADRTTVSGLGADYYDRVREADGRGPGSVVLDERVDRTYTGPADLTPVDDAGLDRTVEVHHAGHSDVVVWNPGARLSREMSDLTDEGYRGFVCVETGRIGRGMVAEPGHPDRLATTLRVVRPAR